MNTATTNAPAANAAPGHNHPPVQLPNEEVMLADLNRKYPEIDKRLQEWGEAFATYPEELRLDQEDVAQNLQDLIGQVKKESRTWDAHQKAEKGPLNKLVKVVTNFFTTRGEKADKLVEQWGPVHQDFLTRKATAARVKAEEEAERQRKTAEESRLAAEAAERERIAAEARAAEERRKEEEARAAAARAEADRVAAEQRRQEAEATERRLAEEKKVRDREEKEVNNSNLRDIRRHMKEAERLHLLAEADEATEDETAALDNLVKTGGVIGNLATPVANSLLLDDDQKVAIEGTRARLGELRVAINERLGKREQKRRAKEQAEAEAAEERDRAAREERRQREEEEARVAREAREKAEKDKAEAEAARVAARGAIKDADAAARDAQAQAKDHGRTGKAAAADADRAGNRADRIDNKLDKSTDADLSRTRGDLGTVGSLARRWAYYITDEAALRAGFIVTGHVAPSAPLAEHLTTDALEGAVFRWMRLHQSRWEGQTRIEGQLPGVVFAYEQEARIA